MRETLHRSSWLYGAHRPPMTVWIWSCVPIVNNACHGKLAIFRILPSSSIPDDLLLSLFRPYPLIIYPRRGAWDASCYFYWYSYFSSPHNNGGLELTASRFCPRQSKCLSNGTNHHQCCWCGGIITMLVSEVVLARACLLFGQHDNNMETTSGRHGMSINPGQRSNNLWDHTRDIMLFTDMIYSHS